jgi:hypothetical protein
MWVRKFCTNSAKWCYIVVLYINSNRRLKAIEEGVTVFKYFVTVATGEYSHGGTDTLARSKGNWHGHTSDRDVRPVDLQSRTAAPHNSDWTPRLCGLALSSGWEGKKISSYGHRTRYG